MEADAPVAPGGEGGETTRLLRAACDGDVAAAEPLLPLVYGQLPAPASSYVRREPAAHTLQPIALVHEEFRKRVGGGELNPRGSVHFFAPSARVMRQILVYHARGMSLIRSRGRFLYLRL